MKILILNITINWVYRLYEEYILSIINLINLFYKDIIIENIYIDVNNENINNELNNILLKINNYDKIFLSGDIAIANNFFKKYHENNEYIENKQYTENNEYARNMELAKDSNISIPINEGIVITSKYIKNIYNYGLLKKNNNIKDTKTNIKTNIDFYFINIEQMSNESYYKNIRILDNKINIIDYSEENIPFFSNIYNKIYLISPYFKYKSHINNSYKTIDIISFVNNEYRKQNINNLNLSDKYKIVLLDNCYGERRNIYFEKSKIYINFHCSDNHNTMELIRIVNLIMNKVIVITQKSILSDLLYLKDYIIECNDITNFNTYIVEILDNYETYFHKFFDNFNESKYLEYIKTDIDKLFL